MITVSKVFNHHLGISPATREWVLTFDLLPPLHERMSSFILFPPNSTKLSVCWRNWREFLRIRRQVAAQFNHVGIFTFYCFWKCETHICTMTQNR